MFFNGCATRKITSKPSVVFIISDVKPYDGCVLEDYTAQLQHKIWECVPKNTNMVKVK
jgi:hypothetical protein